MKIRHIAKYIDQPLIVNKISTAAPAIITGCAAGLGIHDVFIQKHNEHEQEPRRHRILKNIAVLTTVGAASLISSRGLRFNGKKLFDGLIEEVPKAEILKEQKSAVENFVKDFANKPLIKDEKLVSILEKAKNKALSIKETGYVLEKTEKEKGAQNLIETLFGKKEDLSSAEIFGEIKRLSLLGLVPVAAGVGAGIAMDRGPHRKHNNSDRIKEGFYQYFANIFLCNVGAGAALFGLESLKKLNVIKSISPSQKFIGMVAGIMATGVIGGSFIANYLSKKVIDPFVLHKKEKNLTLDKIYDERTPEGLDMAMHIDDLATAGVLSGLKWIEPVLPAFYLFSGYRAGMGYRNQEHHH